MQAGLLYTAKASLLLPKKNTITFVVALPNAVCRDLRDAALDEASRTKSELRQMREAHEDLLLASRDAASRADVLNSQLMGELKLKGFELSRLQVCQGPRGQQPARWCL